MHEKLFNGKYYAETYSDADIKQLCEVGEIAPKDLDEFRRSLEDMAAIYRWKTTKRENPPDNRNIRRELKTISKQANRLLTSLEEISGDSQSKIEARASTDGFSIIEDEALQNGAPSLAISLSDLEISTQSIIIDVPTLRTLLGGLAKASEEGIGKLPKRSPGKSRSWPLHLWMANAESLWKRTTDQPFIRDAASQNDPITNAARFCVAAFQMVNSECPSSLIMTEMKARIKDTHRRTG